MAGLGIYHYQARFYSPKLGRFLSADTIVPGYANPQNLNRYSYVLNNPLKYIDPSGHCSVSGHWIPDSDPACQWASNNQGSLSGNGNGGFGGGNGVGGGGGGGDDDDSGPNPIAGEPVEPNLGGSQPRLSMIPDPGGNNLCSSYDAFCANVSGQVLEDYLHNVFEPYQNVLTAGLVLVPIAGGIGLTACLTGMVDVS